MVCSFLVFFFAIIKNLNIISFSFNNLFRCYYHYCYLLSPIFSFVRDPYSLFYKLNGWRNFARSNIKLLLGFMSNIFYFFISIYDYEQSEFFCPIREVRKAPGRPGRFSDSAVSMTTAIRVSYRSNETQASS